MNFLKNKDGSVNGAVAITLTIGVVLIFATTVILILRHNKKKREEEENKKATDLASYQKYLSIDTSKAELLKFIVAAGKDSKGKSKLTGKHLQQISTPQAQKIAKLIYDSKGLFDDDETLAVQAFAAIPSLHDMLLINQSFTNTWVKNDGRDIITYATGFMNDAELAKLSDVLKKKPSHIFS